MISVRISDRGFEISGHSGYAVSGDDIVCAAVSSAAEMTANAIVELIGADCTVDVDEDLPRLSLVINDDKGKTENCKLFLNALQLQIDGIKEAYPEYLTIK